MKTMTLSQAQARYDAMEPPDDPVDPYGDLCEFSSGTLRHMLDQAEACACDPDVPRVARRRCDTAALRITLELRQRGEKI